MRDLLRIAGTALVGLAFAGIVALMLAGGFRPLDDTIRDQRFSAAPRTATGSVVFVDIDAKSLEHMGVWPWPRTTHAQVLDKLMALGANDVVFDVDFSVASTAANDAAFAASLDNAGGFAHLAAFQQQRDADGTQRFNLPLPSFAQYADPVAVNVSLDNGGVVRTYPFGMTIGSTAVPSAAALLAGVQGLVGGGFNIDFSIDPRGIDHISVSDLLDGNVDAARVAGKQVIIGASAVELRDFFVVPRYGIMPGALLQAMATETLKQGRALQPVGAMPALAAIAVLGLLALVFRRRVSVPMAIVAAIAVSLVAEGMALYLQVNDALLLDTAAVHAASVGLVVCVLATQLVKRGQQRLKAMRERDAVRRILDRVITDNFDGVVVVDGGGRIVTASEFAMTVLGDNLAGRRADDVLPQSFAGLLAAPQRPGELLFERDGKNRILEYVVTRSEVLLGDTPSLITCLTFRDITARRAAETQLRFIGDHDVLTGVLRRTTLLAQIEAALAHGDDVAVIVVNLRRFRLINDTLGHSQGDGLLKQVASRLRSMGPDAVARLGADSFALVVPHMDADKLRGFAQSVAQWLAFPYELAGGHQAIIAACVGATTSLVSGRDAEVLLSHADMALSVAKQTAGNAVALFTPDMDDRLKDRQAMDFALRQGLAARQFTLAYQPQVDLKTREIVGAEALMRWTHPTLGPVSPARFIPAAEETGLIIELGRSALREACREAANWPRPIKIAVNVSPVQFELSDVVGDIVEALELSGLAPERLDIEITEGIFVKNFETMTERLQAIRRLGVGIALDDFGTGYSSLSYLGQLPIDKIKIDQSFVRRLPNDAQAAAIIRAVVALSDSLGKRIIAEGIETPDQAWMLQMSGCGEAQGYLFGRPMPEAQLVDLLKEWPALAASA
jgi:diguanylate cyclase (GGDEF)-like protein